MPQWWAAITCALNRNINDPVWLQFCAQYVDLAAAWKVLGPDGWQNAEHRARIVTLQEASRHTSTPIVLEVIAVVTGMCMREISGDSPGEHEYRAARDAAQKVQSYSDAACELANVAVAHCAAACTRDSLEAVRMGAEYASLAAMYDGRQQFAVDDPAGMVSRDVCMAIAEAAAVVGSEDVGGDGNEKTAMADARDIGRGWVRELAGCVAGDLAHRESWDRMASGLTAALETEIAFHDATATGPYPPVP